MDCINSTTIVTSLVMWIRDQGLWTREQFLKVLVSRRRVKVLVSRQRQMLIWIADDVLASPACWSCKYCYILHYTQ